MGILRKRSIFHHSLLLLPSESWTANSNDSEEPVELPEIPPIDRWTYSIVFKVLTVLSNRGSPNLPSRGYSQGNTVTETCTHLSLPVTVGRTAFYPPSPVSTAAEVQRQSGKSQSLHYEPNDCVRDISAMFVVACSPNSSLRHPLLQWRA